MIKVELHNLLLHITKTVTVPIKGFYLKYPLSSTCIEHLFGCHVVRILKILKNTLPFFDIITYSIEYLEPYFS